MECHAQDHSDPAFTQHDGVHYSPDKFGVTRFCKQIARLCIAAPAGNQRHTALGLGFYLGRTAFAFDRVTGIDDSTRCIDIAFRIKKHGKICDQLCNGEELAPGEFLVNIHQRLVVGGLLAIASPNNWLEHFTPRKQWFCERS